MEQQNYQKIYEQSLTVTKPLFSQFPITEGRKPTYNPSDPNRLQSKYKFQVHNQINQKLINQKCHSFKFSRIFTTKKYPYCCIGLIVIDTLPNKYKIYSTGILISPNLILTSVSNIYDQKLNVENKKIVFIPSLNGNIYTQIYKIKRIYYAPQFTKSQDPQQWDFALLQLYYDVDKIYGYLGLCAQFNLINKQTMNICGYRSIPSYQSEDELFLYSAQINLKNSQFIKSNSSEWCGYPIIANKAKKNYYIVGLLTKNGIKYLDRRIANKLNEWTAQIRSRLIITSYNINVQACRYIKDMDNKNLIELNLVYNKIGPQGCYYLTMGKWIHLMSLNLSKYLTIQIIRIQVMKDVNIYNKPNGLIYCFLTQVLINIDQQEHDNINQQGCKYLTKANWPQLNETNLAFNNIQINGCVYFKDSNWMGLALLNLTNNNINNEGCKYLIIANWLYLQSLDLSCNNIGSEGCKYLKESCWENLQFINLNQNKIDREGIMNMKDTYWPYVQQLNLCRLYQIIEQNDFQQEDLLILIDTWGTARVQI